MTRRFSTILFGALLTGLLLLGHVSIAPSAQAASVADLTPHEARLFSLINQARAANGLVQLGVAGGAVDVARSWAATMAGQGQLYHNPNYVAELRSSGSGNATSFAENVAYGYPTADAMFQAYMNSSGHRANILSPGMRFIGIGSLRNGSGTIYNTMNFVNAETGTYGSPRVAGDSFGGATQTMLLLRNAPTPGGPDIAPFSYGGPRDASLACDINNDGRDDLISFNNGFWAIRTALNAGAPTSAFSFGWPGSVPVCGNWDGAGGDGIGIFFNGRWLLRNTATAGAPDASFDFGAYGYFPVVGDWDGDGADGIGVVHSWSFAWSLRNAPTPGTPDALWTFGFPGAVPVPGNFVGNRGTELGIYANGTWYLRTGGGPGPARTFGYGGAGYRPLTGDWNNDGIDGVGVAVSV